MGPLVLNLLQVTENGRKHLIFFFLLQGVELFFISVSATTVHCQSLNARRRGGVSTKKNLDDFGGKELPASCVVSEGNSLVGCARTDEEMSCSPLEL